MIELKHLRKEYPNSVPLKDINAVIQDGDVISIIGPSGTGKSTLLRCINRLETPTAGEILYNGINILDPKTDICAIRKKIGMVFQSFNLFPHMTVIENVMKPQMDLLGKSRQEAYDKALELLASVGLRDRAFRLPEVLSGGQKQRVAIARTLAMDNDVLLFDEPTSALDPAMVGEVQSVIRKIARTGKTILIVTHEMKFAREVANRVFYLDEGSIYDDGTPEQIFDHPEKEKTRKFIRRIKEYETEINSSYFDYYSGMSEIRRFASANFIEGRTLDRIEHIYEETVCNVLLPHLGEKPHIRMLIEYSELSNEVKMQFFYEGEGFNPLSKEEDLSVKILRGFSDSVHYCITEEGTNLLTVGI